MDEQRAFKTPLAPVGRRLTDKVAIVTGAASGIGRATAQRFAAEGGAVVAADIQAAQLEELCNELVRTGCKAKAVTCNISDENAVKSLVEEALKHFGHVDILANVAGISAPLSPVEATSLDEFLRVLSVNLIGTFLCIKHVAGSMKQQRYGRIINVASISAIRPTMSTNVAYAASKGGVAAMTRQLVKELSPYGITTNSVAPGVIQTPLTTERAAVEGGVHKRARLVPLGRISFPEELAASMAFLASDDAAFINGAMLVVDGGMTTLVGYSAES